MARSVRSRYSITHIISQVLGYVVEDARRNGGFRAEWRFMMGDLALLIAAGRYAVAFNINPYCRGFPPSIPSPAAPPLASFSSPRYQYLD